jgi:hypothetical protein
VVVNPDAELSRIARKEGWDVIRFETLGRRLKVGGAIITALAAGGIGNAVRRRRAPVRRRPPLPRPLARR